MGQDRIVMTDGTTVIDAGNVLGGQDSHNPGQRRQRGHIYVLQFAMGHSGQAQCRVQGAHPFGNIVGVEGLTTDMQGG